MNSTSIVAEKLGPASLLPLPLPTHKSDDCVDDRALAADEAVIGAVALVRAAIHPKEARAA